jgi:RNA polymerase sigma-70 factor (ECF subfamily)
VVKPEGNQAAAGSRAPAPDQGASDQDLVAACLNGHRDAFDAIVARHQRMVYRVCYRFVGSHEDASDLAQDVFVRAYRGLRAFRGGSALSTWLYRIAVNTALNHVGSRPPAAGVLDAARQVDTVTSPPDERIWRRQEAARVRAAIAKLPDRQRATLILRVYHELTYAEIARVLGSSVGTAKANVFHALRKLKGLLGTPEPRR